MNGGTLYSHGAYLRRQFDFTSLTDIGFLAVVHGGEFGGNAQRVDDGSVREKLWLLKAESTDQPLRSRNARKAHVHYFLLRRKYPQVQSCSARVCADVGSATAHNRFYGWSEKHVRRTV